MRRTLGVLSVLLSILIVPAGLSAQEGGQTGGQANGFKLEQNYPNPFNPETKIPFILGEELFAEGRPGLMTKTELYDKICGLLGGRAAEEAGEHGPSPLSDSVSQRSAP